MPRFRIRTDAASSPVGDPRALFEDVLRPCHFYIGPGLDVVWQDSVVVTYPWEIYQGRLLDVSQTRERRTFLAWSVTDRTEQGVAERPLIGILWNAEGNEFHVVRSLLCHAWQACDAGGGVIESRETTKWVMELVGTATLGEFADGEELRDELICRLWQAVVGTSRLPLTSLEAPLPAFVLGRLAYVYRGLARGEAGKLGDGPCEEPMRGWRELVEQGWLPELARREQAKLLECVLRAVAPAAIADAAACCIERWKQLGALPRDLVRLLKTVFNEVSLSPWTGFVGNALGFVQALVQLGEWSRTDEVDFLSWLLRQLSRHLTAYDLVTFHHRGANYPDALLLDATLKRLLDLAEQAPALFEGEIEEAVLRRRALRAGVLLRRAYEGHAVPDAPTSPGENTRVLPAPYQRVREDQLTNPRLRERKLFADDPLAKMWTSTTKQIFRQGLEDVGILVELVELGMAVFIDRPFGLGKTALEPDQTPLLAQEVCSATLIARRMDALAAIAVKIDVSLPQHWTNTRKSSIPQGAGEPPQIGYCAPVAWCASLGRPVASLTDAKLVSADFAAVRTLPNTLQAMMDAFDWQPLCDRFAITALWHNPAKFCSRLDYGSGKWNCLVIKTDPDALVSFETDSTHGFRCRGGVELPVAGLRIWAVRDDAGVVHDLRGEDVHVLPRW